MSGQIEMRKPRLLAWIVGCVRRDNFRQFARDPVRANAGKEFELALPRPYRAAVGEVHDFALTRPFNRGMRSSTKLSNPSESQW